MTPATIKKDFVVRPAVFWLALAFIGGVSAYDSFMSVESEDYLAAVELNPMAKYLIDLNGGGVALLVGVKTFSTSTALLICHCLFVGRYRRISIVMWALVIVQFALLCNYIPYLFVH